MDIGTSSRPKVGEHKCGDNFTINRNGVVTIAIADGLGHGPMAEIASKAFCEFVSKHLSHDLERILGEASKEISSTRGAVAGLVRIDESENSMLFSGIGNIEVQAVSMDPIRPICMPGIIGRKLRKTKQFSYHLHPGDVIALYSDGISGRFDLKDYKHLEAKQIAETIMANHGKQHDDATIIAIKY